MTYTLTRTDTNTGKVLSWDGLTKRELGQSVYFCAVDNLRLGHTATSLGMEAEKMLTRGEAYQLGAYKFEAMREKKA